MSKSEWVRGKDESILPGARVDHKAIYEAASKFGTDLAMAAHCWLHGEWPVGVSGDPLARNLSHLVVPVECEA